MSELTRMIILLTFALVLLVLGILNLKGKLVDTTYARKNDERAGDKVQKLGRALGYFVVSLFMIWRAFGNRIENGTMQSVLSVFIAVVASGVLVPPVMEWIRNRKSAKVVMVQIVVETVIVAAFFLFIALMPNDGWISDFASFFISALMMIFLIISIYTPRRYGLTAAIVIAMIPFAIVVDSSASGTLFKILGFLTGTAAAYGLDYVITRCFRETI